MQEPKGASQLPSYFNLFIGNVGGCIGETSALAILIGGAYLLIKKVIRLRIPLAYLLTLALGTWIFAGPDGFLQETLCIKFLPAA